jgi:hypothetical protein
VSSSGELVRQTLGWGLSFYSAQVERAATHALRRTLDRASGSGNRVRVRWRDAERTRSARTGGEPGGARGGSSARGRAAVHDGSGSAGTDSPGSSWSRVATIQHGSGGSRRSRALGYRRAGAGLVGTGRAGARLALRPGYPAPRACCRSPSLQTRACRCGGQAAGSLAPPVALRFVVSGLRFAPSSGSGRVPVGRRIGRTLPAGKKVGEGERPARGLLRVPVVPGRVAQPNDHLPDRAPQG